MVSSKEMDRKDLGLFLAAHPSLFPGGSKLRHSKHPKACEIPTEMTCTRRIDDSKDRKLKYTESWTRNAVPSPIVLVHHISQHFTTFHHIPTWIDSETKLVWNLQLATGAARTDVANVGINETADLQNILIHILIHGLEASQHQKAVVVSTIEASLSVRPHIKENIKRIKFSGRTSSLHQLIQIKHGIPTEAYLLLAEV